MMHSDGVLAPRRGPEEVVLALIVPDELDGELRKGTEGLSIVNLLALPGSAGLIPQSVAMLRRFTRLISEDKDFAARLEGVEKPEGHERRSARSGLVLMSTSRMPTVAKRKRTPRRAKRAADVRLR